MGIRRGNKVVQPEGVELYAATIRENNGSVYSRTKHMTFILQKSSSFSVK